MRKIIFFLVPVLCIGIFSCQKQIDWGMGTTPTNNTGGGTGGGGTGNATGLLRTTRIRATSGSDSSVTNYFYNGNSKVIARSLVGFNFAQSTSTWDGFERNSAGLIIKTKSKDNSGTNPLADTVVTNYFYTTGSPAKLAYSFSSLSILGFTQTDSTVFTYNSAGQISKMEGYGTNFLSSTPSLSTRQLFTYDGAGNCTKVEMFNITNGVPSPSTTIEVEYDTKTPAIELTSEESIIITTIPANKHTPLKTKTTLYIPGMTQVVTTSDNFVYNSTNRPATGTRVQMALGTTVNSTLTSVYQ